MLIIRRKALDVALKQAAPIAILTKEVNGDTGSFTGYASTWGNVDAYGERVMPGAFTESLVAHKQRGSSVKMFWQHDPSQPIGRWTDIAEDKKGLYVAGQLNLKVQRAVETHALLMGGDIDGISIGYRIVQAEDNDGVFELQKVDLVECSIVSMPANTRATVDEIKSSQRLERMDAFFKRITDGTPPPVKEFEDFLRDAGVPKSLATKIASVGYAKAIRSDSDGAEAEVMVREMLAAGRSSFAP